MVTFARILTCSEDENDLPDKQEPEIEELKEFLN